MRRRPEQLDLELAASFQTALYDAIAARGVSLEWLRARLIDLGTPVSSATLSYWRSGRSQPEHQTSLDALATLEELLHLSSGDLESRLGPSRRLRRRPAGRTVVDMVADTGPRGGTDDRRSALSALGYDPDAPVSLWETSCQIVVEVDAQGKGRSFTARSVWEASRDGATGVPILFWLANPGGPPPTFSALGGCSIGATELQVDNGAHYYELLLAHPLNAGESGITEHQILLPAEAEASNWFEFDVNPWLSEAVLWVRFDPRHVPVRCEGYTIDAEGVTRAQPLPPSESVHYVARGSRSNLIGLRWEF